MSMTKSVRMQSHVDVTGTERVVEKEEAMIRMSEGVGESRPNINDTP
jgi:hypothetical protein